MKQGLKVKPGQVVAQGNDKKEHIIKGSIDIQEDEQLRHRLLTVSVAIVCLQNVLLSI